MPGITDPSEAYFKDGVWGWDGAVWRKLPMVWGYSEILHAVDTKVSAGGASDFLSTIGVPAGEVWVVTNIVANDRDTAPSSILFSAVVDGVGTWLVKDLSPVVDSPSVWANEIYLRVGDSISVYFYTVIALDRLSLDVLGYKMKVAE